jgi:hypothetical protein
VGAAVLLLHALFATLVLWTGEGGLIALIAFGTLVGCAWYALRLTGTLRERRA